MDQETLTAIIEETIGRGTFLRCTSNGFYLLPKENYLFFMGTISPTDRKAMDEFTRRKHWKCPNKHLGPREGSIVPEECCFGCEDIPTLFRTYAQILDLKDKTLVYLNNFGSPRNKSSKDNVENGGDGVGSCNKLVFDRGAKEIIYTPKEALERL